MISTLSLLLLILAAAPSLPELAFPKPVVPNFPDLTIKTRRISDGRDVALETVYLKGARQRSEFSPPAPSPNLVSILQCDEKLRYSLNPSAKTYTSFPIEDWAERIKHAKPFPQPEPSGANVLLTVDSVDTGETRAIGPYLAHHVKMTEKVEPGPGAVTPPSVTETDGWYLDLKGFGCSDSAAVTAGWLTSWPGKRDRIQLKRLGRARRGYAIEETSRRTQEGRTTVSKLELIEFSDKPLDSSLFELPSGYQQALRNPSGGYDMSRQDTLHNRLQAYWEYVKLSSRRWFR
jgi:hypothetical protein